MRRADGEREEGGGETGERCGGRTERERSGVERLESDASLRSEERRVGKECSW